MEDLFLKFPHLSEKIFGHLPNKGLAKSKEVCRSWHSYLDPQKFLQIRIIEATVQDFHSIGDAWKNVFVTASTDTIMDLGRAVSKFYVKEGTMEKRVTIQWPFKNEQNV